MYFMMSIDCETLQFAVEDAVIAQFDTYLVSNCFLLAIDIMYFQNTYILSLFTVFVVINSFPLPFRFLKAENYSIMTLLTAIYQVDSVK